MELGNRAAAKINPRTYATDVYSIINGGFGAALHGRYTVALTLTDGKRLARTSSGALSMTVATPAARTKDDDASAGDLAAVDQADASVQDSGDPSEFPLVPVLGLALLITLVGIAVALRARQARQARRVPALPIPTLTVYVPWETQRVGEGSAVADSVPRT